MNILYRILIVFEVFNQILRPIIRNILILIDIMLALLIIVYVMSAWKHTRDEKQNKKLQNKWKKNIKKVSKGEKDIEDLNIQKNKKRFRNFIIKETNDENINLELLKKIYIHYGFLGKEKKFIKSVKWWKQAEAIKRLKDLEFRRMEDEIYKLIHHDRFEVRLAAIDFLGTFNSSLLHDKVSQIFKENKKQVDRYLILKLFPSNFPVQNLKELVTSESIRYRKAAAILLGKYKNYEALNFLEELLKDPEEEVKIEAIKSLGRVGTPLTIPKISEGIDDDNKMVRAEIARSLGRIKDQNSLYLLRQLADDPEYVVRVRAFTSMSRFGDLGRELLEEFRESYPKSTDEAMLRSFFYEVEDS